MFDSRINEIWHTIKVSIQDGGAIHDCMEFENQWKNKKVQEIYRIKFDFFCFICLFRQAQRNSLRYSLACRHSDLGVHFPYLSLFGDQLSPAALVSRQILGNCLRIDFGQIAEIGRA